MTAKPRRLETYLTYLTLFLTATLTLAANLPFVKLLHHAKQHGDWLLGLETLLFMTIVLTLIYGSFVYQVARLGYLRRLRRHQPVPETMRHKERAGAPAVTILIPSYKEELRTIEQTVLSAALQPYPNRRVVLLLDDPPKPNNLADKARLEAARDLIAKLDETLKRAREAFITEQEAFQERCHAHARLPKEHAYLGNLWLKAAEQIAVLQAPYQSRAQDHTDSFFAQRVLNALAQTYKTRAQQWHNRPHAQDAAIASGYAELSATFDVELSSFERKRYSNLSHEANKAMNLNSYIGLIGKHVQEVTRKDGVHLLPAPKGSTGSRQVPDADYIVTLDADSILIPGYIGTLVARMEDPAYKQVAVAQTPYHALPGAPGILERIAGATTDLQYLVHQGSAQFNAGYWVGANAVLRKTALETIAFSVNEGGKEVTRYIQDRTVIEDTESTIDLIAQGWEIYNYPEALAYSATPPDFGAILVQRRRWANGGLLILPKLLKYLMRPPTLKNLNEGFLRVHYLFSLTGVNLGLLLLFLFPFDPRLDNAWLPLTALPYYLLYTRDLKRAGYQARDILPVYAFNLMLIPIQLGGVTRSLRQVISGKKTTFSRTPKIARRTSAPRNYLLFELLLFLAMLTGVLVDSLQGNWDQVALGIFNTAMFFFIMTAFIGWRSLTYDLTGWDQAAWRRSFPTLSRSTTPQGGD